MAVSEVRRTMIGEEGYISPCTRNLAILQNKNLKLNVKHRQLNILLCGTLRCHRIHLIWGHRPAPLSFNKTESPAIHVYRNTFPTNLQRSLYSTYWRIYILNPMSNGFSILESRDNLLVMDHPEVVLFAGKHTKNSAYLIITI